MSNIAIFASGSGTNAQAIVEYFNKKGLDIVKLILSNKPDAYVIERAKQLSVPYFVFDKETFYNSTIIIDKLKYNNIDFIILAGFLWLMPVYLLKYYKNRIINIHPALLPKYGGKGMFGMRVHNAVIANCETETGITIHFVNEEYDKGKIIFQAKCKIEKSDTPESIAQKVHKLEYEYYPIVIEKIIFGNPNLKRP